MVRNANDREEEKVEENGEQEKIGYTQEETRAGEQSIRGERRRLQIIRCEAGEDETKEEYEWKTAEWGNEQQRMKGNR